MPRGKRANVSLPLIGIEGTSSVTPTAPFHILLNDAGGISGNDDIGFVNYSTGSVDVYYSFTRDAYIHQFVVTANDSGINRFVAINDEGCLIGSGNCNNGFTPVIRNASDDEVTLTLARNGTDGWINRRGTSGLATTYNQTAADQQQLANQNGAMHNQSTTARNQELNQIVVDFKQRFGAPLYVANGEKFLVTLTDNWVSLNDVHMSISGYYA